MSRRPLPQRTGLPVSISQRIEFASQAWLDSARAFLERKLDENGKDLPNERFVAVECYTDCPSHLNCPNNEAVIHISIDNGVLDVAYGDLPNPTFKVTADYNRALVIGSAVYEQLPGTTTATST